MTQDYIDSMEEVFLERNFELGEDIETVRENLAKAASILSETEVRINRLADELQDGIVFDESAAILAVQNFVFASKFKNIFSQKLAEIQSNEMYSNARI